MSPADGIGLVKTAWIDLGSALEKYSTMILQATNYLSDIKAREITNTDVLQLEEFIKHLYETSKKHAWKLGVRTIITEAYARASSLAYIVMVDHSKRSSAEFFKTVIELTEMMELLKSQVEDPARGEKRSGV